MMHLMLPTTSPSCGQTVPVKNSILVFLHVLLISEISTFGSFNKNYFVIGYDVKFGTDIAPGQLSSQL